MSRTIFAVFVICLNSQVSFGKFFVTREWNYVNFTWPSAQDYQSALHQRLYIPENNILAGLKYFENYYYVTLPRMKEGVPATLARFPVEPTTDTHPLLSPFPSWGMNTIGDCNALQNVQNVEIDPHTGDVWIIDGGRTETLSKSPAARCSPKLLVYNIKKMEIVLLYRFPDEVASSNGSFLYDIVLDTDAGYAYITDNGGRDPGIIVFSTKDHKSWKIRHSQSMRADPYATTFQVNDILINAPLNIASIALGPKVHTSNDHLVVGEDREVFYAPISSLHLYSISSGVLKNEMFGVGEIQGDVVKDHGEKSSQSVGMVMDNKGVLYYSLLRVNSVARWDSNTPFHTGQKIVAKDKRYLEWVNSFTFNENNTLTVLVNGLNRFIYDNLNTSEPNFRLIASHIEGFSYLHNNDNYNYQSQSSSTTASESPEVPTTEKETRPMKPGLDQDPYLSPQPEPSPVPEPASSESPRANSESTSAQPQSSLSSERKAIGLLVLMTAGLLFAM